MRADRLSSVTPTPSPNRGNSPAERADKQPKTSFRDTVKRPMERTKERPTEKRVPVAGHCAHVREDGLLVAGGLSDATRDRGSGRFEPAAKGDARPLRPVALTNVRIGGTKDSAQVHARLGEGRHTGVELRAVERHGKVSIELVTHDPQAERALRGELSDLREALRVRGLEHVSVDVRAGDDDTRDRAEMPDASLDDRETTARSEARVAAPLPSDDDAIVL